VTARRVALVAAAAAVVAMAAAFGIGAAILLLLVLVVVGGVVYSLATVGDWMQAWGRRAGDSEPRRRRDR
jgi:hypothetical protein